MVPLLKGSADATAAPESAASSIVGSFVFGSNLADRATVDSTVAAAPETDSTSVVIQTADGTDDKKTVVVSPKKTEGVESHDDHGFSANSFVFFLSELHKSMRCKLKI